MVIMGTIQRRNDLLVMIQDTGGLTIKEIAEKFDVSRMTISTPYLYSQHISSIWQDALKGYLRKQPECPVL